MLLRSCDCPDSFELCSCSAKSSRVPPLFRGYQRGVLLGAPGFLLLGLFFAPASEKKNQEKSKTGASEMISVPALAQITEKGSAENSLFEGHDVI